MDYEKRVEKVRAFLKKKKGDCFITFNSSNIFYLTGLLDIEGWLVISEKEIDLFVPELYFYESLDNPGYNKIKIHIYKRKKFFPFLENYKKILFINSEISYLLWLQISKVLKEKFTPVENFILEMRAVKEKEEIELIEKAKEIAEKTLKEIKRLIDKRKNLTELDLVSEIKYKLIKNGARKESFEPIVASGVHSSYPHHKSKNKAIKKGEVIVIDMGADFCGYKSDLTATFFYGEISDEIKKIYNIVKDVQKYCIEFVLENAGNKKIKGKQVHKKAVEIFKKYKLEKYFIHGLGHGIGIDVHEKPQLSPGSKDIIEKGNVFTIEPGLYFHNKFGIRIENMLTL